MITQDNSRGTFAARTYGKSELAMLYFPTAASAHTAVNHLMSWITRCRTLHARLHELGYTKTAKWFTPKQVEAIVEYLGAP